MRLDEMKVFKKRQSDIGLYGKYATKYVACIAPNARLILSKTVMESLNDPKYVIFRTDGKNIIAISAAEEGTPDAYRVSNPGGKTLTGYGVISAVSLLKSMKYNVPEYAVAYSVEYHHKAIWLDLTLPPSRA